jgi:spermidine synthase
MLTPAARRLVFGVLVAGCLVSFFPHLQAQEYRIVHEVRSPFQRITVVDTGDGHRRLIFDGRLDGSDPIQSEMNLARPYELALSYTRTMMSALPLAADPKRILLVGLGGASMQRFLHNLLPEAVIETAELDPEVYRIAVEYFQFKEDDRQIVHIGDGREFIEKSRDSYDLIFLDAYSAASIPYRLATVEFLEAVKARLATGGVVCANLLTRAALFSDMIKTYTEVFPELHLVRNPSSGNTLLVALDRRSDLKVETWAEKAEVFEKAHPTGLDLPRLIRRGAAGIRIPARATVLRDKKGEDSKAA